MCCLPKIICIYTMDNNLNNNMYNNMYTEYVLVTYTEIANMLQSLEIQKKKAILKVTL